MPAALTSLALTETPAAPVNVVAFDNFAALRAAAPALADSGGEIFHSLDWFDTLATHGFDADARPLLLLASASGQPPLCLPLVDGPEVRSLSNFYSSLFGPIAGHANSAHDLQGQLAALALHLHGDRRRWPLLSLQPLDQDAPFYRDFSEALRQAGYWVDSFHCFANWTLLLAGRSFEQYFASLPSRLQNTIRRASRKLDRAGTLSVTIHRQTGPALDSAIADFEAIYAASWKTPEPYPHFISAWCNRAAERGWLRLGLLSLDGQALAAQLWLVKDGKASIFKLAYREGSQPYSPGSVLTADLMREVIDNDGVNEVDFLSGDDAYKQDWMSHRRERRGLLACRRDSLRGLLAAARHQIGKGLHAWRQRGQA